MPARDAGGIFASTFCVNKVILPAHVRAPDAFPYQWQ
jgi:hypothetical protein